MAQMPYFRETRGLGRRPCTVFDIKRRIAPGETLETTSTTVSPTGGEYCHGFPACAGSQREVETG